MNDFLKNIQRKKRINISEAINMIYEITQDIDTVEAYEDFVEKYPNFRFTRDVELHLEDLDWIQANEEESIESYKGFLQKYPDGQHADSAKLFISVIETLGEDYLEKVETLDYRQAMLGKYNTTQNLSLTGTVNQIIKFENHSAM